MSTPQFYGLYKGICINNNDPEGLNRITASVPTVFTDPGIQTDWAWPMTPPGLPFTPPLPNSGVWIGFEGGDTQYPYWSGVWSNAATVPIPTGTLPVGGSFYYWSDTLPPASPGVTLVFLHGQTITGGVALYPTLALRYPFMVSGADLVMPDTRNRVPMGAGGTYEPGVTGGAANVTLATTHLPAVSASISDSGHNHGGSTGAADMPHIHAFPGTSVIESGGTTGWSLQGSGFLTVWGNPNLQTDSGTSINHAHTIGNVATGIGVSFGNATPTPVPTVPPFIARHEVMRIA